MNLTEITLIQAWYVPFWNFTLHKYSVNYITFFYFYIFYPTNFSIFSNFGYVFLYFFNDVFHRIILRAITMFVTVLPKSDPSYTCHPKLDNQTALPVLGTLPTLTWNSWTSFLAGLRIRIRFRILIRIQSGQWIRIQIQEGKNGPQKDFKSSCFEVLDGLFWDLKASSITWTFFMEA